MESFLKEVISRFCLRNDYIENCGIWVGHAKIGGKNQPSIEEAKKILAQYFGTCIADSGQETPEWLMKNLKQWKNFNPFNEVREKDQPLFVKKLDGNKIVVAVIWPWQIKRGIASLMVYEGECL